MHFVYWWSFIGGGSAINEATPSTFFNSSKITKLIHLPVYSLSCGPYASFFYLRVITSHKVDAKSVLDGTTWIQISPPFVWTTTVTVLILKEVSSLFSHNCVISAAPLHCTVLHYKINCSVLQRSLSYNVHCISIHCTT